jgi:phosphoribosyl 1,2-cyclic phosphodiesterase
MFRTAVIASGSKGNCVLVTSDETAVLVDVGIAARRVWSALENLRFDRNRIAGILVSHEHGDHISGVGAVSRSLHVPVYITRDTYMACRHRLGNLHDRLVFITAGETFTLGDMVIHPFSSPHDAVDSCNFTISGAAFPERKLAIATDVGYQSRLLTTHLANCTTLILESNHDLQMLKDGPYDWNLKQRILSNHGHLSNLDAVGVISQVIHSGLKNLILAHLSEVNNLPDLAEQTMRSFLCSVNSDTRLLVADQYTHTDFIDI